MPYKHQELKIKRDYTSKKQYYKHARYPPIHLNEGDIYLTTRVGDRLDIIAQEFYNDTQFWWVIAQANPSIIKRDSIFLKPGIQIRVPINIRKILDNFEKLNR